MKTLIWKELRENFKWAVLAMIGLCLAEIYGLNYIDRMNYNNQGLTLCNPPFLMATSLGNAVVGLLLGFLQILPEQRRDQWAALLHRPVSRGVIYRGKAVAGVLLYLLATVPPFLLCLWLAATPGHFVAPFVPELTLASLSDIFVGLAYYFAALVTALQRGSWFGARSFALLSAVYLSCSLSSFRFFHVVVEMALILAVLLFAAAWGAMLSNGKFGGRPFVTKAALLLAVFLGVCGLGNLVQIMMNAGKDYDPWTGGEYQITKDGTPFVRRTNEDLSTTVTGLDGKPLPNANLYTGQRYYQNVIQAYDLAEIDDHPLPDYRQLYFNYRQSRQYIEENQQYGQLLPTRWFYLTDYHFAVGIDRRTKRVIQIVDRGGFHAPDQPIQPFTGTIAQWYESPCLVQEGTGAFIYDLEKEQITPLPGADTSPIRGMNYRQYMPGGGKGYDQLITVARANGIQNYDSKGAPMTTIAYNPKVDLERWGSLSYGVNDSATRFYLEYGASSWLGWGERRHMPIYLDEVDATGAILHSYTLPPLPQPPWKFNWTAYVTEGLRSPAFWYQHLAYVKIGAALGSEQLAEDAKGIFGTDWGHTRDVSERVLCFSFVFAVIALVWARRAGMSWNRAAAWSVFVFAFNIAGLITFRAVADWPVRVACPSCQRRRDVEEALCRHCSTGWPEPTRQGLEIFSDSVPIAAADPVRN